jgi:hypothetical protein
MRERNQEQKRGLKGGGKTLRGQEWDCGTRQKQKVFLNTKSLSGNIYITIFI